jgi:hypothetical protein
LPTSLCEDDEIRVEWRNYKYSGKILNRKILKDEEVLNDDDRGCHILRSEFYPAVNDLKEKKAQEIDEIPSGLLKNAGEKTVKKLYE